LIAWSILIRAAICQKTSLSAAAGAICKVYVDLNSKLQHAGQHLYRGDLIESLKLQDRW
jgi:hypothetical protein